FVNNEDWAAQLQAAEQRGERVWRPPPHRSTRADAQPDRDPVDSAEQRMAGHAGVPRDPCAAIVVAAVGAKFTPSAHSGESPLRRTCSPRREKQVFDRATPEVGWSHPRVPPRSSLTRDCAMLATGARVPQLMLAIERGNLRVSGCSVMPNGCSACIYGFGLGRRSGAAGGGSA